jgi:hypothetical protein
MLDTKMFADFNRICTEKEGQKILGVGIQFIALP